MIEQLLVVFISATSAYAYLCMCADILSVMWHIVKKETTAMERLLFAALLVASAYVCLRMCVNIISMLLYIGKNKTTMEENHAAEHAAEHAESNRKGGAPRKVAPQNALAGGDRSPPV